MGGPRNTNNNVYELIPSPYTGSGSEQDVSKAPNNPVTERPRGETLGQCQFLRDHPVVTIALVLGVAGALGCFGFTFWLSHQPFSCPDWALDCHLASDIPWITSRIAQVQGIISTFFGVSISMIAYATYQVAETTLWPLLARRPMRLRDIDKFLSAVRGSIPSSTVAVWNVREAYGLIVVFSAFVVAVLLQVNSAIVGYAFDQVLVPTPYRSNTTIGGGMGFSFIQGSGASLPAVVGYANNVYAAWSNGWGQEPMIAQRNFLFDRGNMSVVGDICANAVEYTKHVDCAGTLINLTTATSDTSNDVASTASEMGEIFIRKQPKLTLWVDDMGNSGNYTGWATIVFAALNGTIENGTHMNAPRLLGSTFTAGVSSLKCNVTISLADSSFCTSGRQVQRATLSTLDTLTSPGTGNSGYQSGFVKVNGVAKWLAAVITTYGNTIENAQPMFEPGIVLPNQTLALPTSYTSQNVQANDYWSQATLKNFIDVGAGALATTLTKSWLNANAPIHSLKDMPRLETRRAFYLLIPLVVALSSFILLFALSAHLHRVSAVHEVRLGGIGDTAIASQTDTIAGVVKDLRSGTKSRRQISRLAVRYERDAVMGLGGFVQSQPS